MTEKPILFSGEMVRAILDGRKAMTRRLIKPQPVRVQRLDGPRNQKKGDIFIGPDLLTWDERGGLVIAVALSEGTTRCVGTHEFCLDYCQFGTVGDRLWVREAFWINHFEFADGPLPKDKPTELEDHPDQWCPYILYRADGSCFEQIPECECATEGKPKWRPSIHMPRWASRITLEITGVRVERLQEISEEDAKAEVEWSEKKPCEWWEGYRRDLLDQCGNMLHAMVRRIADEPPPKWMDEPRIHKDTKGGSLYFKNATAVFKSLWQSIHGDGSWDANPWVWVISFRRIQP